MLNICKEKNMLILILYKHILIISSLALILITESIQTFYLKGVEHIYKLVTKISIGVKLNTLNFVACLSVEHYF